jgi:dTDP-glucose pyrophosphorylase
MSFARRTAQVPFEPNLVTAATSLRDAMSIMTATSTSIVLVVDDDQRLIGVVVDGDIRRAILIDADISRPVSTMMTRSPRTGRADMPDGMLRALAEDALSTWLPLVDDQGRITALLDLVRLRQASRRLPNTAVLMAGGRGERLMPLTANTPKPMLVVGGRPMLETVLRLLHAQGFERFLISVNYLADQVKAHFGDGSAFGVQIEYLHEDAPLGTAGGLKALQEYGQMPFLVMNGDVIARFDARGMIDRHQRERALLTVAVKEHPVRIPFGVIDSVDGRLLAIREKPIHSFDIAAGIYMIDPSVLHHVPRGASMDMPDLIRSVNEAHPGKVLCFPVSDSWIDLGRKEDLARAEDTLREIFPGGVGVDAVSTFD